MRLLAYVPAASNVETTDFQNECKMNFMKNKR